MDIVLKEVPVIRHAHGSVHPSAIDGEGSLGGRWWWIDPQSANMQRVREHGVLRSAWTVYISPHRQGWEIISEFRAERARAGSSLHTWAHSGWECMYRTCTRLSQFKSQYEWWRNSWSSPLANELMAVEDESVFSKDIDHHKRLPILQEIVPYLWRQHWMDQWVIKVKWAYDDGSEEQGEVGGEELGGRVRSKCGTRVPEY